MWTAAVYMWNCLPPEVTSASSLTTFHTQRFCSLNHILTFGLSDIFVSTRCLQWT